MSGEPENVAEITKRVSRRIEIIQTIEKRLGRRVSEIEFEHSYHATPTRIVFTNEAEPVSESQADRG